MPFLIGNVIVTVLIIALTVESVVEFRRKRWWQAIVSAILVILMVMWNMAYFRAVYAHFTTPSSSSQPSQTTPKP